MINIDLRLIAAAMLTRVMPPMPVSPDAGALARERPHCTVSVVSVSSCDQRCGPYALQR